MSFSHGAFPSVNHLDFLHNVSCSVHWVEHNEMRTLLRKVYYKIPVSGFVVPIFSNPFALFPISSFAVHVHLWAPLTWTPRALRRLTTHQTCCCTDYSQKRIVMKASIVIINPARREGEKSTTGKALKGITGVLYSVINVSSLWLHIFVWGQWYPRYPPAKLLPHRGEGCD